MEGIFNTTSMIKCLCMILFDFSPYSSTFWTVPGLYWELSEPSPHSETCHCLEISSLSTHSKPSLTRHIGVNHVKQWRNKWKSAARNFVTKKGAMYWMFHQESHGRINLDLFFWQDLGELCVMCDILQWTKKKS